MSKSGVWRRFYKAVFFCRDIHTHHLGITVQVQLEYLRVAFALQRASHFEAQHPESARVWIGYLLKVAFYLARHPAVSPAGDSRAYIGSR
jgi:hypothetical protein